MIGGFGSGIVMPCKMDKDINGYQRTLIWPLGPSPSLEIKTFTSTSRHIVLPQKYIGIVHKNVDPNRDLRCQVDGLHASLESSHNTK